MQLINNLWNIQSIQFVVNKGKKEKHEVYNFQFLSRLYTRKRNKISTL